MYIFVFRVLVLLTYSFGYTGVVFTSAFFPFLKSNVNHRFLFLRRLLIAYTLSIIFLIAVVEVGTFRLHVSLHIYFALSFSFVGTKEHEGNLYCLIICRILLYRHEKLI